MLGFNEGSRQPVFLRPARADASGVATDSIQDTSELDIYDNVIEYQSGAPYGWQVAETYYRIYNNVFLNCHNFTISKDYARKSGDSRYQGYNNIVQYRHGLGTPRRGA
jgi:hypothetical protein